MQTTKNHILKQQALDKRRSVVLGMVLAVPRQQESTSEPQALGSATGLRRHKTPWQKGKIFERPNMSNRTDLSDLLDQT